MFNKIFNKTYIKGFIYKIFYTNITDNNNIIIQSLCHI